MEIAGSICSVKAFDSLLRPPFGLDIQLLLLGFLLFRWIGRGNVAFVVHFK